MGRSLLQCVCQKAQGFLGNYALLCIPKWEEKHSNMGGGANLRYLFKGGTVLCTAKEEVVQGSTKEVPGHWQFAVSGFDNLSRGVPIIYGYFDARKLIGIKRNAYPIFKELAEEAFAKKHLDPNFWEAMQEKATQVNPVYRGREEAKARVIAMNAEPLEEIEAGNGLNGEFNSALCTLEEIEAGNGLNGKMDMNPIIPPASLSKRVAPPRLRGYFAKRIPAGSSVSQPTKCRSEKK
jgi:hypothetical protein